jgi:hypothetical protein
LKLLFPIPRKQNIDEISMIREVFGLIDSVWHGLFCLEGRPRVMLVLVISGVARVVLLVFGGWGCVGLWLLVRENFWIVVRVSAVLVFGLGGRGKMGKTQP